MKSGNTDAIQLLLTDHQKVRDLFQQYRQAGAQSPQRGSIARQVLTELEAHSKIEEEIFYPAVRAKADQHLQETVAEGYQEHATVDNLVTELKAIDPMNQEFDRKFQELMADVEHHVQEEESEMLPDARQKLGDETARLGREMMQRKQQIIGAGTMR